MRLVIKMIISEYNVTDNFVGLIVDGRRIVAEIETNDKKKYFRNSCEQSDFSSIDSARHTKVKQTK